MIKELEIRIAYTEGRLKLQENELRKTEDSIKMLEGELIAYKELVDFLQQKEKEHE